MPKIYEFRRNNQEKIIIQIQEYKGKEYLDIRIYYDDSGGRETEWSPTPKGIKIKPELLPELLKGLEKARETIKERAKNV